ncbi:MAG TPA: energy transducer TonB [Terriglobales bacterium]|nr:energy transducer TonB [Terriglobales bacterium]
MKVSSLTLFLLTPMILTPAPRAWAQADGTVSARKVVSKVTPAYPRLARTMNLSGAVRVEVLVSANGTVKSVEVKGGNPVLAQAAQDAVRQFKWEKTDHETTELVEFNFTP